MKKLASLLILLGLALTLSAGLYHYASRPPAVIETAAAPASPGADAPSIRPPASSGVIDPGQPVATSMPVVSEESGQVTGTSRKPAASRRMARSAHRSAPAATASIPGLAQRQQTAAADQGIAPDSAPASFPAQRVNQVTLPKVVLPLAFQDIDLFVSTPQGLRHAPVNYNSANKQAGAAPSASGAPATPAAPVTPGAPGTLVVNEPTAAALEQLRQDFVDAVGGLNQNASDPVYARVWKQAQMTSDQRFIQQYGFEAFNNYQIAAAQKAAAERLAAAQP